MQKWQKILLGVFIALVLWAGTITYLGESMPWKITDPHDPRFNEEKFRFLDYETPEELQETLRVMFPVGTPKEKLDRILYENQHQQKNGGWGASMKFRKDYKKLDEKKVIQYMYVAPIIRINIYNLQVYYDKKDRVKEIADHGVPIFNQNFFQGSATDASRAGP